MKKIDLKKKNRKRKEILMNKEKINITYSKKIFGIIRKKKLINIRA